MTMACCWSETEEGEKKRQGLQGIEWASLRGHSGVTKDPPLAEMAETKMVSTPFNPVARREIAAKSLPSIKQLPSLTAATRRRRSWRFTHS
jgi:hypothetical protein